MKLTKRIWTAALTVMLAGMVPAGAAMAENGEAAGTLEPIMLGYYSIVSDYGNMTISSVDVEHDLEIEDIPDQVYAGKPVEVELKFRYRMGPDRYVEFKLTKDVDYTVSYQNNNAPGTATVTVTGKGEKPDYNQGTYGSGLYGSLSKTFKITGSAQPSPGGSGQGNTNPGQPAAGETQIAYGTLFDYGTGSSAARYMVTGADTTTYMKSLAAKNAKKLAVPNTAVYQGKVFNITAVAAKAFSGRGKLTKLTIGAGVASIGGKAFSKCKKLKVLTVKSKLLTPAGCRKCLKGSSVTAVKVPKAKKKAYKKIFKKSVCGKSVKLK